MTDWECGSQSYPAVCGVSCWTGSFTTASRMTGTLWMFLLGGGGWPRSSSLLSLLASGSGNVDTQSGEQPQKPQESSWEDAGREGEVEPWNALRRVTHLFTSWTQWTLPESTTSTLTSPSHLSLPLSPLFCSLTYPNTPGSLGPPLPSSYWWSLPLGSSLAGILSSCPRRPPIPHLTPVTLLLAL